MCDAESTFSIQWMGYDYKHAINCFVIRLYGVRCRGCMEPIPSNELVMRAVGGVYHVRCFVCVVCGQQLHKGDQFVASDAQIYCRLDFEKKCAAAAAFLQPLSPCKSTDWFNSKCKWIIIFILFRQPWNKLSTNTNMYIKCVKGRHYIRHRAKWHNCGFWANVGLLGINAFFRRPFNYI